LVTTGRVYFGVLGGVECGDSGRPSTHRGTGGGLRMIDSRSGRSGDPGSRWSSLGALVLAECAVLAVELALPFFIVFGVCDRVPPLSTEAEKGEEVRRAEWGSSRRAAGGSGLGLVGEKVFDLRRVGVTVVPGRGERVRPLLEAAGGAAGGGDVIPLGE